MMFTESGTIHFTVIHFVSDDSADDDGIAAAYSGVDTEYRRPAREAVQPGESNDEGRLSGDHRSFPAMQTVLADDTGARRRPGLETARHRISPNVVVSSTSPDAANAPSLLPPATVTVVNCSHPTAVASQPAQTTSSMQNVTLVTSLSPVVAAAAAAAATTASEKPAAEAVLPALAAISDRNMTVSNSCYHYEVIDLRGITESCPSDNFEIEEGMSFCQQQPLELRVQQPGTAADVDGGSDAAAAAAAIPVAVLSPQASVSTNTGAGDRPASNQKRLGSDDQRSPTAKYNHTDCRCCCERTCAPSDVVDGSWVPAGNHSINGLIPSDLGVTNDRRLGGAHSLTGFESVGVDMANCMGSAGANPINGSTPSRASTVSGWEPADVNNSSNDLRSAGINITNGWEPAEANPTNRSVPAGISIANGWGPARSYQRNGLRPSDLHNTNGIELMGPAGTSPNHRLIRAGTNMASPMFENPSNRSGSTGSNVRCRCCEPVHQISSVGPAGVDISSGCERDGAVVQLSYVSEAIGSSNGFRPGEETSRTTDHRVPPSRTDVAAAGEMNVSVDINTRGAGACAANRHIPVFTMATNDNWHPVYCVDATNTRRRPPGLRPTANEAIAHQAQFYDMHHPVRQRFSFNRHDCRM